MPDLNRKSSQSLPARKQKSNVASHLHIQAYSDRGSQRFIPQQSKQSASDSISTLPNTSADMAASGSSGSQLGMPLEQGNRTTQSTTSRMMKTTRRGRPFAKVSVRSTAVDHICFASSGARIIHSGLRFQEAPHGLI